MGEQDKQPASQTSPVRAADDPVLPPTVPSNVPVGATRKPNAYPLRGRVLCWLFWKCWLNPVFWVLHLFFRRWNPYRRMVILYASDPLLARLTPEQVELTDEKEAKDGK